MRSEGVRQYIRLGGAVIALTAALLAYFWPVVGPQPTRFVGGDLMAQTYPWRRYVTEELYAGRLPHWTPYVGFGFPLLADSETTVFYPPSAVSRKFGTHPGCLLAPGNTAEAAVLDALAVYPVGSLAEAAAFLNEAPSQGQRKRLALLTAFLEDRPIYVFDPRFESLNGRPADSWSRSADGLLVQADQQVDGRPQAKDTG